MPELFIEFFSEEIPARMQSRGAEDLKTLAGEYFSAAGFADVKMDSYVTPRRLVLVAHNLPLEQPDRSEEIKGPRIDAPEQALNGFMQANGLKSLDGVEQRAVGKATHYFISRQIKGEKTALILLPIIHQIYTNFSWPKSMRWGDKKGAWVRPLIKINAVFDNGYIHHEPEFYGHRFLSPKPFKANSFEQYKSELRKHHVILDQSERRAEIWAQAEKLAAKQGLVLRADEGLLNEVTGLVEWPTAMLGAFEKEFLAVPQECLIATMRANQKYFPLFDAAGKLANYFILIANVPGSKGEGPIVHGNERVLRARLSDAKFFYEQDLKTRLSDRLEKLKTIQFHEKLGTLFDKTSRVTGIAKKLAAVIGADETLAARAAQLCKADLVSGMVGEFPELQGIMGRYYALHDGEDAAVADAVRDHYQPLGPAAEVPRAPVSIAVALADKLDTLTEFFRIGEKPTGSKDPYALRRAALGVIRIILENKIMLPLSQFTAPDVLEFIKDRLQVALRDQGIAHDQVKACLNIGDDIALIANRARDLRDLLSGESGKQLLEGYRRAANILKAEEKKGSAFDASVQTALLKEAAEQALYEHLTRAEPALAECMRAQNFSGAMTLLINLRGPIDTFFNDVMVNAVDPEIRVNRLNLLGQIRNVFQQFADFSQIEG